MAMPPERNRGKHAPEGKVGKGRSPTSPPRASTTTLCRDPSHRPPRVPSAQSGGGGERRWCCFRRSSPRRCARSSAGCSPRGGARRRMERSTSACFSRRDDCLARAQGRAPHRRRIEVPSAARRRSATCRRSQHRLLLPLLDPPDLFMRTAPARSAGRRIEEEEARCRWGRRESVWRWKGPTSGVNE
jgi:hypothetical protein